MRGAWSDGRQATAAEVRLDAGKSVRFCAEARPTGGVRNARFTVAKDAGRAILASNHRESEECRLNPPPPAGARGVCAIAAAEKLKPVN